MGFDRARVKEMPAALRRGLSHFRSASWSARVEYATVVALACATELVVRTMPITGVARFYGVTVIGQPAGPATGAVAADPAEELPAWAARRLAIVRRVMRRWPVQGTCLRHCLVAGQRLRALHPELKIGVGKADSEIIAHAWLVIGGRSLDPTASRYAELPSVRA